MARRQAIRGHSATGTTNRPSRLGVADGKKRQGPSGNIPAAEEPTMRDGRTTATGSPSELDAAATVVRATPAAPYCGSGAARMTAARLHSRKRACYRWPGAAAAPWPANAAAATAAERGMPIMPPCTPAPAPAGTAIGAATSAADAGRKRLASPRPKVTPAAASAASAAAEAAALAGFGPRDRLDRPWPSPENDGVAEPAEPATDEDMTPACRE